MVLVRSMVAHGVTGYETVGVSQHTFGDTTQLLVGMRNLTTDQSSSEKHGIFKNDCNSLT